MENNKNITEQQEMKEVQQAQKTGTVDFSAKKEEKEKSGNYTHMFKEPIEIEGTKNWHLLNYMMRGQISTCVVNGH